MALIDKFSKYLIDEHIEKEEKKKQEGMPKELGFSVDRVQIAQPIANIVNEFMAMLPHSEWKCFPSNDIPSIEYSDKHSIYTNSHFESYGQIQLDNTNLKSLYMGYDNFTCYYVFTGNTYYWRKGAKYVKSSSYGDENSSVNNLRLHYENFQNTYCKLINEYGHGLSQEYITCPYYNNYSTCTGKFIIFKDGNIYDWRLYDWEYRRSRKDLFFVKEYEMREEMYKAYPLSSVDSAEKFFLNILKRFHKQGLI